MKLGIMQPYFFPYIGYWQLLNYVDTYIVYDDVNFIKSGWINRNYILSDGKKQLLTLHLQNAGSNKLINEIKIGHNTVKILKTIRQEYSKAPFFNFVFPLIEDILSSSEDNLSKFILHSIQSVANYLNINTKIIMSSDLDKNNSLRGQDKVIAICNALGAKKYINPIGGCDLYKNNDFEINDIELKFLKSGNVLYKQFEHSFVPWLSIIDVLMFNSPEEVNAQMKNFELI